MKIFIGICFFILLSLVGCGDKKGKEVSEVPVIRLDPDHVDTLKVSDYFSHIDGFVLRDSIFYNIQGFQEFPDKYIMVARIMPISLGVNVEYMCSIKKVIFSRPWGRSVGDLVNIWECTTVCSSPTIVFCMSWTIRNIFVIP